MAVRTKKSRRIPMMVVGVVMLLFSSPCVLAMFHDLITGTDNLVGALMVGGFFSIVAAVGLFLLGKGFLASPDEELIIDANLERAILKCASQNNGVLTVGELAMQTELGLDQAETALNEFSRRGHVQLSVNSSGGMEYVFPDFHSEVVLDELEEEIERAAVSDDAELQREIDR